MLDQKLGIHKIYSSEEESTLEKIMRVPAVVNVGEDTSEEVVASPSAFDMLMGVFQVKDTTQTYFTDPSGSFRPRPTLDNLSTTAVKVVQKKTIPPTKPRTTEKKEEVGDVFETVLDYIGLAPNEKTQEVSLAQSREVEPLNHQELICGDSLRQESQETRVPASPIKQEAPPEKNPRERIYDILTFPEEDFGKGATELQRQKQELKRRNEEEERRRQERVRALMERHAMEKIAEQEPIRKEKSMFEAMMDTLAFSNTCHSDAQCLPCDTLASQPDDDTMVDVVNCMAFPEQQCARSKIGNRVTDRVLDDRNMTEYVPISSNMPKRMQLQKLRASSRSALDSNRWRFRKVEEPSTIERFLDLLAFPEKACVSDTETVGAVFTGRVPQHLGPNRRDQSLVSEDVSFPSDASIVDPGCFAPAIRKYE